MRDDEEYEYEYVYEDDLAVNDIVDKDAVVLPPPLLESDVDRDEDRGDDLLIPPTINWEQGNTG